MEYLHNQRLGPACLRAPAQRRTACSTRPRTGCEARASLAQLLSCAKACPTLSPSSHLFPGLHVTQRTVLASQVAHVGASAGWHALAAVARSPLFSCRRGGLLPSTTATAANAAGRCGVGRACEAQQQPPRHRNTRSACAPQRSPIATKASTPPIARCACRCAYSSVAG